MRFIGGKRAIVNKIYDCISSNARGVQSVFDIFAGSGIVTQYLANKGYDLISNDALYFSYVLLRGTVGLSCQPQFANLRISNPIEYLNTLSLQDTNFNTNELFVYNNYSPNENCSRMYFQPENAIKIDIIRLTIERWHDDGAINEDEYYYLLASLISAVPYVSNIAGVYAAYLKHWDKRTYNKLTLVAPHIESHREVSRCFNGDYMDVIATPADLLYADPPYNSREYLPNYHILETIAKYDYPEIKGITGLRNYQELKSHFVQNEVSSMRLKASLASVMHVICL